MLNPHNPALIASIVRNLDAIIAARPKAGDVAPVAPAPPAPKTAAEREFDAVKAAALVRQATEQKAAAEALATRQAEQAEEDRAVAMILDASHL